MGRGIIVAKLVLKRNLRLGEIAEIDGVFAFLVEVLADESWIWSDLL
jgi:hypothetical protein